MLVAPLRTSVLLLPVWPLLPMAMTNLPAFVNLRTWLSFERFAGLLLLPSAFPRTHTKPLESTVRPCSFDGHWYPGPLCPPQPWMKLPAWSNSITGGAGTDFVSGAVERGFASVCGRLRIHTWPWSSPVTADPNPILYFVGTFGQAGSFSN